MRRFEPSDMDALNEWRRRHGSGIPISLSELPRVGFVEPNVAAGFLFQTDSSMALIHDMVTNPEAPPKARLRAIHAIMDACGQAAIDAGFTHVLTWASGAGSVRRAIAHGCVPVEEAMILGVSVQDWKQRSVTEVRDGIS